MFDFSAIHGCVVETADCGPLHGSGIAVYSEDKKYRYLLVRKFDKPDYDPVMKRDRIGFLMLNPSKATAFANDPTITRCINFAKREGAKELWVCNLAALRSTDPDQLLKTTKAVGPRNIEFIGWQMRECRTVICGWGAHKWTMGPYAAPALSFIKNLGFAELVCLGKTKFGAPRHPLYMGNVAPLEPWPGLTKPPARRKR